MRNLTITLLVLLPLAVSAAIYKFYDEDGNIVFSDQPGAHAEKLDDRKIQTIKADKVPTIVKPAKATEPFSYDSITITQPQDSETIRDNNGTVNIDVEIKPELNTRLGHQLVLNLDGKAVAEGGTATSFTLNGLPRGEHTLTAIIQDQAGNSVTSSATVTLYLKHHSILHPTPAATPTANQATK